MWISDPGGALVVRTADKIASNAVWFQFCAACDVLVYATFEGVAVARVGVFAALRDATGDVVATCFEDEVPEGAARRRRAGWTPVVRVPADPAAR